MSTELPITWKRAEAQPLTDHAETSSEARSEDSAEGESGLDTDIGEGRGFRGRHGYHVSKMPSSPGHRGDASPHLPVIPKPLPVGP